VYWQDHKLEIIHHRDMGDEIEVQVAVDGKLSLPMDIHKSVRDAHPTEDEWLDYLTHSGETMIEVYGDARYPTYVESEVLAQYA